jgi:hypothetical protein
MGFASLIKETSGKSTYVIVPRYYINKAVLWSRDNDIDHIGEEISSLVGQIKTSIDPIL